MPTKPKTTPAASIAGGKLTAGQKRKLSRYINAKRELDRITRAVENHKDEVAAIVLAHGGKIQHEGAELTTVESTRWSYSADLAAALKAMQNQEREDGTAEAKQSVSLRMRDTTDGKEVVVAR